MLCACLEVSSFLRIVKFSFHPSTINTSDIPPSSFSFDRDRTSPLGRGSAGCNGWLMEWMARREAPGPHFQLSKICGTTEIQSSMKSLACPMSSSGI